MPKKVERWEANDGTLFRSELGAIKHDAKGRPYKCPKCNGFARCDGPTPKVVRKYDEEATGWGGQFAPPVYRDHIVGYEQVSCDACNGYGWTAGPLEPVTETKIVGWKKPSR